MEILSSEKDIDSSVCINFLRCGYSEVGHCCHLIQYNVAGIVTVIQSFSGGSVSDTSKPMRSFGDVLAVEKIVDSQLASAELDGTDKLFAPETTFNLGDNAWLEISRCAETQCLIW